MAKKKQKEMEPMYIKGYKVPVIVTDNGRFMAVSPDISSGIPQTYDEATLEDLQREIELSMANMMPKQHPSKVQILGDEMFRLMEDGSILMDTPMLRARFLFRVDKKTRGSNLAHDLDRILGEISRQDFIFEDFPGLLLEHYNDVYEDEGDGDLIPPMIITLDKLRFLSETGVVVMDVDSPKTPAKSDYVFTVDFGDDNLLECLLGEIDNFFAHQGALGPRNKQKPIFPEVREHLKHLTFLHELRRCSIGDIGSFAQELVRPEGYNLSKCLTEVARKLENTYPNREFEYEDYFEFISNPLRSDSEGPSIADGLRNVLAILEEL